jgi:GR25 family glycosyltransferase involved in LPS biosynthesis
MSIAVDKIYICHYKKLTERKAAVSEQLNRFKMSNYFFVEHFDKDTWDVNEINQKYPKINHPETKMTEGEKSLALKHSWIVQDMHEKKYASALVLEDDAVLCDNFPQYFDAYMNQLPNDWDIGWVGSCFNLKEPQIPGVNVYRTNRGSRCTHAFCISQQFAEKTVKEMSNVNLPSDHFYNYIVRKFDINNYWFQPPLAFQSLEFSSSLNQDPNHKWDPKEMG